MLACTPERGGERQCCSCAKCLGLEESERDFKTTDARQGATCARAGGIPDLKMRIKHRRPLTRRWREKE